MKKSLHFLNGYPISDKDVSRRSGFAEFGHFLLLLVACCSFLTGCAQEATPAPYTSPQPGPVIETKLTAADRTAIFEKTWQTVNAKFYDRTFGGKDWGAIGAEYREKLSTVQDDQTFWLEVMNPMLFKLGVSHIAALPAEFSTSLSAESFATGSLGVDIRLLDGQPVVTRVENGSPAEQAGLQPGFVIRTVDGWTMEDFISLGLQGPPDNEPNRRGNAVNSLRAATYGEPGRDVVIEYLDADDQPQHAVLRFAPRKGLACGQLDPSVPPACAQYESLRLEDSIGYLRFSGFLEPILEGVLQAIDDLQDAPALIIDLRGNPGGQFPVRKGIASKLVGTPELFMRYQYRNGMEEAYLDPVSDAYRGIVVILVDELSLSSSEEFAGSLQALGRATIIGSQTPGRCLVMNIEPLPKDAILAYPFGQPETPNGRILEGNGVLPDLEVSLDRQQLLEGIDAQLEAAIEFAASQ